MFKYFEYVTDELSRPHPHPEEGREIEHVMDAELKGLGGHTHLNAQIEAVQAGQDELPRRHEDHVLDRVHKLYPWTGGTALRKPRK